jgi:RAP domain
LDAFVSQKGTSSQFQNDVVASLVTLQKVSHVQAEFHTKIGYSLDAVIVYRGNRIGVEVDGPFHFVGCRSQTPNGNTVLKQRQLRTLEGWKLVSIPYWEWDEICDGASGGLTRLESKKQAYLRNLLDKALVD